MARQDKWKLTEMMKTKDKMTDTERLDWLEKQAKVSPTGISFDWIPSVEDERKGYRFMRQHFISEPEASLRDAIDKSAKLLA